MKVNWLPHGGGISMYSIYKIHTSLKKTYNDNFFSYNTPHLGGGGLVAENKK